MRPETLARALVEAWMETGLSRDEWKQLSVTLHTSASKHMAGAYRDSANQWLVSKGVMTRIKQQHTVRKAASSGGGGGWCSPHWNGRHGKRLHAGIGLGPQRSGWHGQHILGTRLSVCAIGLLPWLRHACHTRQ